MQFNYVISRDFELVMRCNLRVDALNRVICAKDLQLLTLLVDVDGCFINFSNGDVVFYRNYFAILELW